MVIIEKDIPLNVPHVLGTEIRHDDFFYIYFRRNYPINTQRTLFLLYVCIEHIPSHKVT